jgi:hypothetical protein
MSMPMNETMNPQFGQDLAPVDLEKVAGGQGGGIPMTICPCGGGAPIYPIASALRRK